MLLINPLLSFVSLVFEIGWSLKLVTVSGPDHMFFLLSTGMIKLEWRFWSPLRLNISRLLWVQALHSSKKARASSSSWPGCSTLICKQRPVKKQADTNVLPITFQSETKEWLTTQNVLTEPYYEIRLFKSKPVCRLLLIKEKIIKKKVLPRFELGLLDSESNVLTNRP